MSHGTSMGIWHAFAGGSRQAATDRWRALARDERGATIIEFAFVAGPFMALMIAILQVSLTFFAQQNLETAADKAVRQLMTGQAQKANMTQAQFKDLVCTKLPSFMKCGNVMIDVRTVSNFSSADTSAPAITYDSNGNPTNSWQFSPGTSGQITISRIMYVWNVQSGPLGLDISTMSGNRRLLSAVNVFKTEPYS